jgi:hypothetical protein
MNFPEFSGVFEVFQEFHESLGLSGIFQAVNENIEKKNYKKSASDIFRNLCNFQKFLKMFRF